MDPSQRASTADFTAIAQPQAKTGWNVLPVAPHGSKTPLISDWPNEATRTIATIRRWGMKWPDAWVGGTTGRDSNALVIDCDRHEGGADGVAAWKQLVAAAGEIITTQITSTPSGGQHVIFEYPDDLEIRNSAGANLPDGIDVRGEGGYVVLAGSPGYSVVVGGPRAPLPGFLRALLVSGGSETGEGPGTASTLAGLLARMPVAGERNDWMTKVCGHLVKHLPFDDAVLEILQLANRDVGLEQIELEKMITSVRRAEARKDQPQVETEPQETSGWLVGDGRRLWAPAKDGLTPWSTFDVACQAELAVGDEVYYSLQLQSGRGERDVLVRGKILGNSTDVARWLGSQGECINNPSADQRRAEPAAARLLRYVTAQGAPKRVGVEWLGEHGDTFVTHEGCLDGQACDFVPLPRLAQWAPYAYGEAAGGTDEARQVLTEVLTFQDETVSSVFGAWWAATLVKDRIMRQTAMFPILSLEGPSETGKTNGEFALALQMAGHLKGPGGSTWPALRDSISAHRNGIVWVDDFTDAHDLVDVLRKTTSEETWTKKGQDRTSQETVRLVAPVVLSGEAMPDLRKEKAMAGRIVWLRVDSPIERRSLRDSSRLQWDDVIELRRRYPDGLSVIAGSVVRLIRSHIDLVDQLPGLRTGAGRRGDVAAVLRVGARILAAATEDDTHIKRVDGWCEINLGGPIDDLLFSTILPRYIASTKILQVTATGGPPAFWRDRKLWVSASSLADWWARQARTPRERQLGSVDSINSQLRAAGIIDEGKRFSILGGRRTGQTDQRRRYRAVDEGLSSTTAARGGVAYGDEQEYNESKQQALELGAPAHSPSTTPRASRPQPSTHNAPF